MLALCVNFFSFRPLLPLNQHTRYIDYSEMTVLRSLLVLACLLGAIGCSQSNILHFSISSYVFPNKTLSMELDITTPRTPKNYPVILFLTGLAGIAPNSFQQGLINQTVSQGVVWITLSKIGNIDPKHMTSTVENVIGWLNNNLAGVMDNRVPGVVANIFDKLVLMGHSAGSHAMTQHLTYSCGNAKMLILFNPVDGTDPFGIGHQYVITPGKMLPFAIPTLILAAELDPIRKDGFPACAPDHLANNRFYNAMSGPKWFVNATKYGHCDFYDDEARKMGKMYCATCKQHCNFPEYRKMGKEIIVHFIDGILNNNRSSLEKIENGRFDIGSMTKHDLRGYSSTPGPFCNRVSTLENSMLHVESQ